jgi:hypothetical protein
MKVDMSIHPQIREQVHAGLSALRVQGKQVWNRAPLLPLGTAPKEMDKLKVELGSVIFSTILWIDAMGFNVLECLDLAVEAEEKRRAQIPSNG